MKEKSPITVVMPEVKLNIAELAYLTGLMLGATQCYPKQHITDKLVFLGLIEMAEIPVCPKAIAALEKRRMEWKTKTRLAVKEGRFGDVEGMPHDLRPRNAPTPSKGYVLTKAGAEFIAKGRARSVTAVKGACL